jgi:hypothetical protein
MHHLNVRAAWLAAWLVKVVFEMRRFGLSEREQERVWEIWGAGTVTSSVAVSVRSPRTIRTVRAPPAGRRSRPTTSWGGSSERPV